MRRLLLQKPICNPALDALKILGGFALQRGFVVSVVSSSHSGVRKRELIVT